MEKRQRAFQEERFSVTGRRWCGHETSERIITSFMQRFSLSEICARLLSTRVANAEEAKNFLNGSLHDTMPDPKSLPDATAAFERTLQAIENNHEILIWGDYDVDGMTSTAMLMNYFQTLGVSVRHYIPNRFGEGYGINVKALKTACDPKPNLFFSVDCGSSSVEALAWLTSEGVDSIVLDHHIVTDEDPACLAFINPRRLKGTLDPALQDLCSAGLVFLFLVGLHRVLRDKGVFNSRQEPELKNLLPLVALGTICDVMPLKNLNRALVKAGLKATYQRSHLGIRALLDVSGIQVAPDAGHVGFVLGPRLNAGGRLAHAQLGVELLTTSCSHRAYALARELNTLNAERRVLESELAEEVYAQADAQHDYPCIVACGDQWHLGLLGILAGRVKDHYQKATFIVGFQGDVGYGSARSLRGLNVARAIQKAHQAGLLVSGGGHAMAAGFCVMRDKLKAFCSLVRSEMSKKQFEEDDALMFDLETTVSGLHEPDLIQAMEHLEPFGAGNPRPCVLVRNVRIQSVEPFGDLQHLRMTFVQDDGTKGQATVFRAQHSPLASFLLKKPTGLVDMALNVSLDRRNGQTRMQLHVEDFRLVSPQPAPHFSATPDVLAWNAQRC